MAVVKIHPLPLPVSFCTIFFAEHEQQLSSAVFQLRVHVCHQSHQFVTDRVPLLGPQCHIPQWRQNLTNHSTEQSHGQVTQSAT